MEEKKSIFDKIINRADSASIKWGRYQQHDIISFGTADMDFESPACIREALIKKAESGLYAYEYKPEGYYQAVTGWFSERYNWKIRQEWLTNCPGMWALLSLCLQAYTMPGDKVLIHAPHFHPAISVIEGAGRKVVTQRLDFDGAGYRFDPEAFETILTAENVSLFFLVNPHNPTGYLFTRNELMRIADICDRQGVMVVSDEINSYLIYDDADFVPYGSISDKSRGNSVTLTSPSKAFNLQGLTYAIGIIPNKEQWEKLEQVRIGMDFDFATNIFSIEATAAAYRDGKEWLLRLNRYLQANLDYMESYIKVNLPQIKLIRPGGGYIAWLDFRELGLTPDTLRQTILDKARVGLTWGETFGQEGHGFERLNFACPRATLKEGLERLRLGLSS
ncbi:MalY/PatB family protein [Mangrovibacter plantisponsor]|uniref:cysteine-S-conjugate beta-lyase n=1 Tax=Mangrovibacter plantisponsor TaxID=451513 RepID=A0A317PWU7_9ENTR|nr:PatB family C-S lyase [Mangrovibacter plantisponsor]PWW07595.1 cystathionine beta-lyase [Mangrovibacter plantisponsor]